MQYEMPNGLTLTRLKSCLILAMITGMTGCGGGGGGGDSSTGAGTDTTGGATTQSVTLKGSVGDGPIVGATVTIKDSQGKTLSSSVSDVSASYNISLKAPGKAYPITLEATGGTDIVTNASPDFRLVSTALAPSTKRANLNPYSTLIVETARSMPGGLTAENIGRASQAILTQLNFGLDTFSVPDPISTPVTGDNVAVIVKASETFGEMIRRTRDALMLQGANVSGDDVMNALAADLTDGVVDGAGGSKADPRIAALSSLTAAQVLIEAMSNNLEVYGVVATNAMDASIKQIMPDAPAGATTGSVRVTAQAIAQARATIKAAQVLAPSSALTTIAAMLDAIQPGASAADVANIMPADTSSDLDNVILSAAVATTEQLDSMNSAFRVEYGFPATDASEPVSNTPTETDPGTSSGTNSAPTISGAPLASATAGQSYRFAPAANDADGDQLTFTITNKPGWADFDASTGTLSGTPDVANVGSYSNISISVSDGSATASLSPFALTVLTDPTSNKPVALYTFEEGGGTTVRDVSGVGAPLDLTIGNGAAVTWNAAGSLTIKSATLIASNGPATKLNAVLKASNAVTLEAWVKPASTTQDGPARIVGLSQDLASRNFTLGQKSAGYDMRLRSTSTDLNGKPNKTSPSGTLTTALTHVVYTRNSSGFVKMYINGVEQLNSTVGGDFSNWADTYRLIMGSELTGEHPWLGTLHRVAIYDHAFGAADVGSAYAAGTGDMLNDGGSSTDTGTGTGGTGGTVNTVPVASGDSVSTPIGVPVTINVLANDSGLQDTPVTVSVISGPGNGTTSVKADNTIVYTPKSGFYGSDGFTYRVLDANGDMATAVVAITVTCSTCGVPANVNLNLTWTVTPGEVLGYRVYYGGTSSTASTFASTTSTNSATYLSADDLNLKTGDQVCFRVKAYNTAGESGYSSAVCKVI